MGRRERGIIPARAGFTPPAPPSQHSRRDHPRSRGVYRARLKAHRKSAGSSPLARGLRIAELVVKGTIRIIPARAGFTYWLRYGQAANVGSSPLARGLLKYPTYIGVLSGIIPARAGFTHRRRKNRRSRQDHPRSRGVYRGIGNQFPVPLGSSPLARGLLESVEAVTNGGGIIPARAGFTKSVALIG